MLEGRETELEVQIIVARSIGSMVERCGHPDERSLRVLARIALDESAARNLFKQAAHGPIHCRLSVWGRPDLAEYVHF
jgi:hypothetical protein